MIKIIKKLSVIALLLLVVGVVGGYLLILQYSEG